MPHMGLGTGFAAEMECVCGMRLSQWHSMLCCCNVLGHCVAQCAAEMCLRDTAWHRCGAGGVLLGTVWAGDSC